MSQWSIPPAKVGLSDQTTSILEAQELLLTAYTEEVDRWNKDIAALEQNILAKQNYIRERLNTKHKWWEWFLSQPNANLSEAHKAQEELNALHSQYLKRLTEQPNPDRYEIGMYVGRLLRGK